MKLGRCFPEQVGVKAPGRPNKIVFSPLIIFLLILLLDLFLIGKPLHRAIYLRLLFSLFLLYILSSVKEMNKIYYTLIFIFAVYLIVTLGLNS